MRWILVVLGAFLLGSVPWGLWLGRLLRGVDVRRHGSGNLGATNVYRVLGPGLGDRRAPPRRRKGRGRGSTGSRAFPLRSVSGCGLDSVMGASGRLAGEPSGLPAPRPWRSTGPGSWRWRLSSLGHSFTPFARFRGGKGAATAAGAWGVVAPLPLAIALGTWVIVFAIRRIVSMASIVAAVALPIATCALRARPWADPVVWLSVVTGALVVIRHRSNLSRLFAGSERPLDLRGPGSRHRGRAQGREVAP